MILTYQMYELRRDAAETLRCLANVQAQLVRDNWRGPARVRKSVEAANAVVQSVRLTHQRPDFGIDTTVVDGQSVEVTEEIIGREAFGQTIRFAKKSPEASQPKVLIVPGLAGHYATLVRGTVESFLPDHDVYIADWFNARDVPVAEGPFGLDEYIEHVMAFLRMIGPGTTIVSVCQPAVACIATAALMAEDEDPAAPAALILIAGPVDTRVSPSRISEFASRQSIAALRAMMIHTVPGKFGGATRRVYPGFLQIGGFMAMDPKRHVRAFADLYASHRMGDRLAVDRTVRFYDEYFAVLDVAEEFYLDTARRVFKEHHLPRGELVWRGRAVDPSLITCPLFTIEGEQDEMCCPGQTEAAHGICTGIADDRRRHLVQAGVGHYGVFAGSVFDSQIYPQIRDFVAVAATESLAG